MPTLTRINVPLSATSGAPAALAGATGATRYVGATNSGAPTSGTFVTGDFVIARDGNVFVCVGGGAPGTWKQAGTTPSGTLIGDGTATDYVVVHNKNSYNIMVQVWSAVAPREERPFERLEQTSVNSVTLKFQTPPAANAMRVVYI